MAMKHLQRTMYVYRCAECGADFLFQNNENEESCPYCGGTLKKVDETTDKMTIEQIVPFQISKEEAVSKMSAHLKKVVMLQDVFSKGKHTEEIQGVYVPFYMVDFAVQSKVVAWGYTEDEYTLYRGTTEVVQTHYEITQTCNARYTRVPVRASSNMSIELMESIEPFPSSKAVPFSAKEAGHYLIDYSDVPFEELYPEFQRRVKVETKNQAYNEIFRNYTVVKECSDECLLTPDNMTYVWMPVWFLRTSVNGQDYLVAMNGQTGKIAGNLPIDSSKKKITTISIFVIAELIMLFLCRRGFGYFSIIGGIFRFLLVPGIATLISMYFLKFQHKTEVEDEGASYYMTYEGLTNLQQFTKKIRVDTETYTDPVDYYDN